MKKVSATVIGLLATPFIAAAIAVGLTAAKQESHYFSLLGLLPIFYFFALAAMILFGLPLVYILQRFNLISWWASLLAGSFIGAIVVVVLRMPSTMQSGDLLTMITIGAISGFSFWLIWKIASQ